MTTPNVNLTVERVHEMDYREMYNLSDGYLKGRLSRFAIDLDDQYALRQRETPKHAREVPLSETNELFLAVKRQIHDILYHPLVLPRHRQALLKMRASVEEQLANEDDPDGSWRRSAQSFLGMVKDELAGAEVILATQQERAARDHLRTLLDAIKQHEEAEDADDADAQLYDLAQSIEAAIADPEDPGEDLDPEDSGLAFTA